VSSGPTFGARYRALSTARERLELDDAENRRVAFAEVDATLDRLVLAALHGEHVVGEDETLAIPEAERPALTERFSVERRRERGAWYVPRLNELMTGRIHLVHWWQKAPRYALSLANRERLWASARANAARQANTDLVVIWAALEPIFEELALPLMLRSGRMAGQKTTEQQLPYWTKTIEPIYEALGAGMDAVMQFAPGTRWGELDADEITARRDALLAGWVRADIDTARRLRTHRISQLVDRYYSKAKNGRAVRKRVISSEDFERTLTAYFGGDWLAFLNYLGEEPEVSEEITTSLPETRLTGTSSARAAKVAVEHGLPPEEVERMLAAYWGQSGGGTPVERRVHVLERLWRELDAVHARQVPGMPSLFRQQQSNAGPRKQDRDGDDSDPEIRQNRALHEVNTRPALEDRPRCTRLRLEQQHQRERRRCGQPLGPPLMRYTETISDGGESSALSTVPFAVAVKRCPIWTVTVALFRLIVAADAAAGAASKLVAITEMLARAIVF
jgi:hypothetical protein